MSELPTLGIDLGNTNCCLSFSSSTYPRPQLMPIDENISKHQSLRNILRSAVVYPLDGSPPLVGQKALISPVPGIRFNNFKQSLLDGHLQPSRERNIEKGPEDALTDILRFLKRCAASNSQLESLFDLPNHESGEIALHNPLQIVICTPTQASDAYNKLILRALVASQWYKDISVAEKYVQFIREPVAAALIMSADVARNYLVCDYGGLTLDLAMVEVSPAETPPYRVRKLHRVQANQLDVGGSFLDKLLLRRLMERLESSQNLLGYARRAYSTICDGDTLARLIKMDISEQDASDSDGVVDVYRRLLLDTEYARISLSYADEVEWQLGTSRQNQEPYSTGIHITREDDIDTILQPIMRVLRKDIEQIIDAEGVRPDRFILAGGCSLTPQISDDLKSRYGVQKVFMPTDYSPMEIIAAGASMFRIGGIGRARIADVTDTDYGIYDDKYKQFDIIVPTGTPLEKTLLRDSALPSQGQGFSGVYHSIEGARMVRIRVGQRVKQGTTGSQWQELGTLCANLPQPQNRFRIYFEIDSNQRCLRVKLFDETMRRLIPMKDETVAL